MKLKITLVLCLVVGILFAGEESLISERPGQALTAFTLKKRAVQIQTGMNHRSINYGNNSPSNSILLQQETTLRFGLGEQFELNSSFKDFIVDPNLGFRARLFKNTSHIFSVQYTAYLSQLNDKSFSNSLTVLSHHQLSDRFDFSSNATLNYSGDEISENYVLSFGFSATSKIGFVLEQYGNINGSDWDRYFDLGISYLITPKFQIDTYFGGGSNEGVKDWFVNGGLTYRLDY